jgi:hypothetical protein
MLGRASPAQNKKWGCCAKIGQRYGEHGFGLRVSRFGACWEARLTRASLSALTDCRGCLLANSVGILCRCYRRLQLLKQHFKYHLLVNEAQVQTKSTILPLLPLLQFYHYYHYYHYHH